jgi:hypothetical protein
MCAPMYKLAGMLAGVRSNHVKLYQNPGEGTLKDQRRKASDLCFWRTLHVAAFTRIFSTLSPLSVSSPMLYLGHEAAFPYRHAPVE